jgi:hypothetical protein
MVRIIRTTCRTRHIEIRPVRSNFLCVAPAAWCITISRRGDPSQKSWRIRGLPFFGLGRDDPPPGAFDPATGLNTALDEGKRGSQVSPLGNFSCLTVRLQRSDDGSMGFATQDDPRHRETILRNSRSYPRGEIGRRIERSLLRDCGNQRRCEGPGNHCNAKTRKGTVCSTR